MTGEFIVPVIDGRGLLGTEAEAAEFRREFADNVAIRPRARMALPVFYFSDFRQKNTPKIAKRKKKTNKKHASEWLQMLT